MEVKNDQAFVQTFSSIERQNTTGWPIFASEVGVFLHVRREEEGATRVASRGRRGGGANFPEDGGKRNNGGA